MKPEPKPRRPIGLVAIIVLQLVLAALQALYLLGWRRGPPFLDLIVVNPIYDTDIAGWLLVAMLLLAVLGLLLKKRWGWIITMILTGFGLSFTIWSYFQGVRLYVPMLIDIIIVLYLNQSEVQQPFRQTAAPESTP